MPILEPSGKVPTEPEAKQVISGRPSPASARPFMTSFLEHLVRNKIITEEIALQAAEWKKQNEKDRRSLIEILKEEFGLSQDVLHYQVAQFYAFRVIDINERSARRLLLSDVNRLLRSLPEPVRQLAMRHKVLPYDVAENQPDKIVVVTPNPADREISDVARAFPFKKFEICYMKERDWAEYWRQLTLDRQTGGTGTPAESVIEEDESDIEAVLDREINRGQLLALVENIFSDAVRVGATDIHIVPSGSRKTDVSFRIDGQLSLWYSIEDARTEAVVAVVKSRGLNMDRFERMAAQDGSVQKVIDNQVVRFSVSVAPVVGRDQSGRFESVVIHILRDAESLGTLDSLGMDPYTLRVFRDALGLSRGLVVLTGPQGSGKTTTLVAALRSVMKPTKNTVTVEEPVEILIEGARQIRLNPKLEFNDALQVLLRHDPDIVMLGEIRDRTGADIALRLAASGRLTFGMIHALDSISALTRLHAIGVEPFLVSEGVSLIVAQRLVRKLCERCKEPIDRKNKTLFHRAGFHENEAETVRFFKPVGCINCVGGFKGRVGIFEAFYNSPEIREILLANPDKFDRSLIREAAIAQGMVTLQRSGVELLKKGVTTLEEVIFATA